MPEFSDVHHINFSVSDLERSAAWYSDVLGLDRGWEMEDVDGRGRKIVLLHPSTSFRIVLSLHATNRGDQASEYNTGMDHVAFAVSDRGQLEAWRRKFETAGVVHSPIKEGATGWLITFRDPDNIQLEMYTLAKDAE